MSKPYSPSAPGLRGARVRRSPGTRRARLRPPAPVALGLRGHAARAAAAISGGVVTQSGMRPEYTARARTQLRRRMAGARVDGRCSDVAGCPTASSRSGPGGRALRPPGATSSWTVSVRGLERLGAVVA